MTDQLINEILVPVNRDNGVPYHLQVQNMIAEYIRQHPVRPGDRLPSETELCQMMEVSRTVIRQALAELAHQGLLVKEQGKGSFVAEAKIDESLVQKLTGFYQDMVERGYSPATQVLKQEIIGADETIAGHLNILPKSPVVEIERLRYINDEPIVLVTTYLPYDLCPQIIHEDLTNRSLYVYLEKECGLVIARGYRTIEAVLATEQEAAYLEVEVGAPLIKLNSTSYLEDDTPIEYYHALHRGDRSRFEVELVRIRDE
jgi:GntR family transcriptional regulator